MSDPVMEEEGRASELREVTVREMLRYRDQLDKAGIDELMTKFASEIRVGADLEEALMRCFKLESDWLISDAELWDLYRLNVGVDRPRGEAP